MFETMMRSGVELLFRGVPLAIADFVGRITYRFHHRTRHMLGDYLLVLIVLGPVTLALFSFGGA